MGLADKDYFTLEEVAARWGMPLGDLAYLAENGQLKVSVRLYGVSIERGIIESADGEQWYPIPEEHVWFRGLQDLRADDLHRVFLDGWVRVVHFDAVDHRYSRVLLPEDGIVVRREALVIRRDERNRVEGERGLGARPARGGGFAHNEDFTEVWLGKRTYRLGPIQARVVRILYEAAVNGAPWRHGKQVLAGAGSACSRMADVFKSQPYWRELILSDGRERYRLNVAFN